MRRLSSDMDDFVDDDSLMVMDHINDGDNGGETKPEEEDPSSSFVDETLSSCLLEPPIQGGGNISPEGLHFISTHAYRSGDYTHLDNLLNPLWTSLTELLPLWLAPNMVTTIGGLHCGVAYAILWYYSPDMNERDVPDWVVFLAGWCTVAYYTLDCMDGKQARRTGSSSPLGQLFDHGFDCMCALFFMSTIASYLMIGGTFWYLLLQTTMQFAFFMAQWEEYHTHVLPHCTGKFCGVTEVNYFLGFLTMANAFMDREAVYLRDMRTVFVDKLHLGAIVDVEAILPASLLEMELRHFLMAGWGCMSLVLMSLSVKRVLTHPHIAGPDLYPPEISALRRNALLKLSTPLALIVAAFAVPIDAVRTRYLSVTLGLAFSILTKKMIVFSMAKMRFGVVQLDAVPFLVVAGYIRYGSEKGDLTKERADWMLGALCLWYTFRLLRWANVTITQICEKLDIYCFRLKTRTTTKKEE
eukprot:CAMPEP_0183760510 /NCGR_PEP_ID=MMETSP0739-20130205/7817_1 /TAXON_ID=385413 /ORGANISM="Thalassiosira miniscula, Strain CCMP1093" /LENGTH=468 /DNA_ID=CAMNT_0025998503 /DNA_START=158 /DNA_END=1564 /DNA_ORIENTATION=+